MWFAEGACTDRPTVMHSNRDKIPTYYDLDLAECEACSRQMGQRTTATTDGEQLERADKVERSPRIPQHADKWGLCR